MAQWRATTSQGTLEKQTRQTLEESTKIKVKSLSLTKKTDEHYEGKAELENGQKLNLSVTLEGTRFRVNWTPEGK